MRRRAVQESDLNELLRRYKVAGDQAAYERLVVACVPLVKYVAGRMGSNLPRHVEGADLVSYGLTGLTSAIERFAIARDIKFATYAIIRIRGAIIDGLRDLDWVPRSARARAREIERANSRLEARLQRAPKDEEVAKELGISVEEFHEWSLQISTSQIVALDELWSAPDSGDSQQSLLDTLPDPGGLLSPPGDDEPPGSDDDAASGVREPRRPKPSGGSDGISLPEPDYEHD